MHKKGKTEGHQIDFREGFFNKARVEKGSRIAADVSLDLRSFRQGEHTNSKPYLISNYLITTFNRTSPKLANARLALPCVIRVRFVYMLSLQGCCRSYLTSFTEAVQMASKTYVQLWHPIIQ